MQKKTVHGFEVREGKWRWHVELDRHQQLVHLIHGYPAGEDTFTLPVNLVPTFISQLRRARVELESHRKKRA